MMDLKMLKEKAQECIKDSKAQLVATENLPPMLFGVTDKYELIFYDIDLITAEDITKFRKQFKQLTAKYNAFILIADLLSYESEKKDLDSEFIEEHPHTVSALTCIIYTDREAFERKYKYLSNKFNFVDSGWVYFTGDEDGTFSNPFFRGNSIEHHQ